LAGDDSIYLDDEFYDSAQPTSAKALPSFTGPFSGTLASIQEQSSQEDIKYGIFVHYTHIHTTQCTGRELNP